MAAERNHLISFEAWIAWRMDFLTHIKDFTTLMLFDIFSWPADEYLKPLIEEEIDFDQLEGRYQIPDITCDPPVGETKTIKTTDANGNIIETSYKNGNLESEITTYKDSDGDGNTRIEKRYDSNGNVTSIAYDNKDGSTKIVGYNSSGKPDSATTYYKSGYYTTSGINENGQYIQSHYYNADGKEVGSDPNSAAYKDYAEKTSTDYNNQLIANEKAAQEETAQQQKVQQEIKSQTYAAADATRVATPPVQETIYATDYRGEKK